MALADNGVVFVGTENGKIYALVGEPNNTPKKILVYDDLKIRLIEKGNSALRYCQNLGIKAGVLLDQSNSSYRIF